MVFSDQAEAEKNKVHVGLGTDIGAGTSFSILQTMNESYKAIKLQKSFAEKPEEVKPLNPHKAFYLATLGVPEHCIYKKRSETSRLVKRQILLS